MDHERVYLSWNNDAEFSTDPLTCYADFEGYRIYRSNDGGITWGSARDRLYDYEGNFIGWKPFAQFDLNAEEDERFPVYGDDGDNDCPINGTRVRGEGIFGQDPMNPRINLGSNVGIVHSFEDLSVIDGIEYTYVITAYDMGLRTYTIEYTDEDGDGIFDADTIWSTSNPRRITVDGLGLASLESPFGNSDRDVNYVRVTPGYYASNVWFPDEENIDTLFARQTGTIGTGAISYTILDRYELTNELLKFEIQAQLGANAFENMACEDPHIYIYEIDSDTNQIPLTIDTEHGVDTLSQSAIDSLLDLPGAAENGGTIYIPEYKMITVVDVISNKVSGIQFEFNNMPSVVPDEVLVDAFELGGKSYPTLDSLIAPHLFQLNFKYIHQNIYDRRLNFDYLFEFFDTPRGDIVQNPFCTKFPTVLPFRITNLTTGKKVFLRHLDHGVDATFDPTQGARDCAWTRNEQILLLDTLQTATGTVVIPTFEMKINFPFFNFLDDSINWSPNRVYEQGALVHHEAMLWRAQTAIITTEPTAEFFDDNNDNPWLPYYPWDDWDSLIVRTEKFYVDGDSWIVDMSLLGRKTSVNPDILADISVVPNPYLVRSGFQENNERRLRFSRLPSDCRITVYTATGELVTTIEHSEPYEGNVFWNLRSGKNFEGPEVAPGLYIFVVEAEGYEHVGKFAVVR